MRNFVGLPKPSETWLILANRPPPMPPGCREREFEFPAYPLMDSIRPDGPPMRGMGTLTETRELCETIRVSRQPSTLAVSLTSWAIVKELGNSQGASSAHRPP